VDGRRIIGPITITHVPVAQCGQTERAVRARVLVVAHPDEGLVEQPHHRGEDLPPGQVARAQVALDLLAQGGEGSR
jgi:hypothetical protein